MISVFDEEQYALNILKNGLNQNKKGLDIFILAKYYKFKLNKNNHNRQQGRSAERPTYAPHDTTNAVNQ